MLTTFLQWLNEDTDSRDHYSWYDHPVHGVIVTKGVSKHKDLRDKHDFEDPHDSIPRGSFAVDHKKKNTELLHYGWTGTPTTPNIENHIRTKINSPKHYGHSHRSW